MQAAFPLLVGLPPPAARTFGLARLDGAGTGLAADRRVATFVQGVGRNRMPLDIGVDLVERPIGERVDLNEAALRVVFRERCRGTVSGLAAPQARHPYGRPFERPRKRHQLPDMTAGVASLDAFVEAVQAVLRSIRANLVRIGTEATDIDTEPLFRLADQGQRFGK